MWGVAQATLDLAACLTKSKSRSVSRAGQLNIQFSSGALWCVAVVCRQVVISCGPNADADGFGSRCPVAGNYSAVRTADLDGAPEQPHGGNAGSAEGRSTGGSVGNTNTEPLPYPTLARLEGRAGRPRYRSVDSATGKELHLFAQGASSCPPNQPQPIA